MTEGEKGLRGIAIFVLEGLDGLQPEDRERGGRERREREGRERGEREKG